MAPRKNGDWLLGIKSLENSHPMAENLKFNIDNEKTLAEAARLRMAGVSHKQAQNILQRFADMHTITMHTIVHKLVRLSY